MEVNQIRLKGPDDRFRVCIEKYKGRVRIRTYCFFREVGLSSSIGYHLVILENARVASQGWAWTLADAMEWLETHTSGLSIN